MGHLTACDTQGVIIPTAQGFQQPAYIINALDLATGSQKRKEDEGSHQAPSSFSLQTKSRSIGQGSVSAQAKVAPKTAPTDLSTDPQENEVGSIDEGTVGRTDGRL